jgi:hypothetical protein
MFWCMKSLDKFPGNEDFVLFCVSIKFLVNLNITELTVYQVLFSYCNWLEYLFFIGNSVNLSKFSLCANYYK